jgi:hypothetical protein
VPYRAQNILIDFGRIPESQHQAVYDLMNECPPNSFENVYVVWTFVNYVIPKHTTHISVSSPKLKELLQYNPHFPQSIINIHLISYSIDILAECVKDADSKPLPIKNLTISLKNVLNIETLQLPMDNKEGEKEINRLSCPVSNFLLNVLPFLNKLEILVLNGLNAPLYPKIIPDTVKSVTLSNFNHDFVQGVFPNSVTKLNLENFNKVLIKGSLPFMLEHLYCPQYNHDLVCGVLPSTLQTLLIGRFAKRIEFGALPLGLKVLNVDSIVDLANLEASQNNLEFAENNRILPHSLTNLQFGMHFDQLLKKGVLPNSLKKLWFGHGFNQIIGPKVLPPSLTELRFGDNFNQIIDLGVLPSSLKRICFGEDFCQSIENTILPDDIMYVKFHENEMNPRFGQILRFKYPNAHIFSNYFED